MITEKIVEAGTVTAHRAAGQGFCRLSEGKGPRRRSQLSRHPQRTGNPPMSVYWPVSMGLGPALPFVAAMTTRTLPQ